MCVARCAYLPLCLHYCLVTDVREPLSNDRAQLRSGWQPNPGPSEMEFIALPLRNPATTNKYKHTVNQQMPVCCLDVHNHNNCSKIHCFDTTPTTSLTRSSAFSSYVFVDENGSRLLSSWLCTVVPWPVHLRSRPSKWPRASLFLQRLPRRAFGSPLHCWQPSIFGCCLSGCELCAIGGYVRTVTVHLPHSTQDVPVHWVVSWHSTHLTFVSTHCL